MTEHLPLVLALLAAVGLVAPLAGGVLARGAGALWQVVYRQPALVPVALVGANVVLGLIAGGRWMRLLKRLRASEQQIRAHDESVPIPLYTWQRAGDDFVLIDYNAAAQAVTQGSVARLRGVRATTFYADRPAIRAAFHRCFTGQRMVVETMPYIFAATGERMDLTAHFVFVPPDLVMVYTVDISQRLQAEAELRRQNAYLTSLHETSLGVLQRRELTTLLETILDNAAALVRAPDGFLIWFAGGDPEGPARLGTGIFKGDTSPPGRRGEGLIGTVWETGEALVLDDYQQWPKRRTGEHREEIRAAVAVPLRVGDEVVGVLSLVHRAPDRRFAPAEVELLGRFAELAAIALDNATLYARLNRELRDREQAEDRLRESEQRYRMLIEFSPAPITVHSEERYVLANAAALALYGAVRPAEIIGKSVYDLSHPSTHALLRRRIRRSYQQRRPSGRVETTLLRVDGTPVEVEAANMPIVYAGKPATMVVLNDITARKEAEARLRESETRYRLMFESNPLPMWVYDVGTLRFLAVNDAAVQHYGYTREEYLAMTVLDIRPPEEVPAFLDFLATRAEHYQPAGVWRHRKRDGTLVEMEITSYAFAFAGRSARLVVANDVTERRRAEEALRHHARHDALTGLPNRTLLLERLVAAAERAARDPAYQFALLYLDLDRFKRINDSLGHFSGDDVLVAAAQRLTAAIRPRDTASRLGGDEFVLLLDEISGAHDAVRIADRVQAALAAPFLLRDQHHSLSASIGIVLGPMPHAPPEDFLRDADTAMYEAKALGKARAVIFDPTMRATAAMRLRLERDLRQALEREELTLVYQPVVALESGAIAGAEALVRWDHPTRGTVDAAEFIALAEETGLIVAIDRWALRAACRQLRRWLEEFPALPDLAVSVNISGSAITHPEFAGYVRAALADTGIAPARLKIEVTERALIEHADRAGAALRELRQIGVETYLDDFGMGYASLTALHRLPIARVKIDRSFIHGEGATGVVNRGLVQAIVALARSLGVSVTAEGIETEEQRADLRALGCAYGQGYHFAPPAPRETMGELLATYPASHEHARETGQ